nr:hypothetical protein [Tanacetum cinerariifolium]
MYRRVKAIKRLQSVSWKGVQGVSAGIAFTRGYRDSSPAMDDEMKFEALDRIVRAVQIPVSADLENGLARTPEGVESNFRRISDMGCGGASIEDIADYSNPKAPVF